LPNLVFREHLRHADFLRPNAKLSRRSCDRFEATS
jgi:hypothetical protein